MYIYTCTCIQLSIYIHTLFVFNDRWREETNSITNKFERVVAELHERLAEEKKRNRDAMDKYNKHKLNNEKVYLEAIKPM